jgi:hypothetical protein
VGAPVALSCASVCGPRIPPPRSHKHRLVGSVLGTLCACRTEGPKDVDDDAARLIWTRLSGCRAHTLMGACE